MIRELLKKALDIRIPKASDKEKALEVLRGHYNDGNLTIEDGQYYTDILYPVKYDDDGNVIFQKSFLTIDDIKELKKNEIKLSCHDVIIAGFSSNIHYGEYKHYSLSETKQGHIDKLASQIQAGTIINALWHDDSKSDHDIWTGEEFLAFFQEKEMFILSERLKSDSLEVRVEQAQTVEEVGIITYESELTEEEVASNNNMILAMFPIV